MIMVDIERPASASSTSSRSKRDDWYELIPQQVELSSPSASKRKTSNSSPHHPTKEARTSSGYQISDQDSNASDGDVFSPAPDFINGVNDEMCRGHYADDNDNHLEQNDNLKLSSNSNDSIQKGDCHAFYSAVDCGQHTTEQYPFVEDEDFVSSSEVDIPLPTSDDDAVVKQTVKEISSEPLKTGALQQAISNISLDFVSGNLSGSMSKLPLDSSFSSVTSQENYSTGSSTNTSPRRITKTKSRSVSTKNKDNKRKLLNGYTASTSEKSSSVLSSKLEKISKSGNSINSDTFSGISSEQLATREQLKDNKKENIYKSNFLPQTEVDAKDTHQSPQSNPSAHEVSPDLNESISFPLEKNAVSMLSDSVAVIDKKPITTSTPYVHSSDKQPMRMKSKQAGDKIKTIKKSTKSPRSSLDSSTSSVEGKKISIRSQSPKQISKAASASSTDNKKVISRSQSPKYVPKHSTSFRDRSQSPKQIAKNSKPSSRSTSVDSKKSATTSPKRVSKTSKSRTGSSSGKSSVVSQSSKSDSNVSSRSKDVSRSTNQSLSTSAFASQSSSNQMSEDSIGSTRDQDSNEVNRGSNVQLPLNLDTLKPEIEQVLEQNVQHMSKASSVTSSIQFGTDSSQSESGKSDSKTATPELKPASSYIQYPSDLQSDNISKSDLQKESDLENSLTNQPHKPQLSRENLSLNMYSQRDALSKKVAELLAENASNKDLSKSRGDSENSSKAGTPDSIEEDQKERAMRMQFLQENAPSQEHDKPLSGSLDNRMLHGHTHGPARSQSPQSDTSTSSSVRAIIDRVMTKGSEGTIDPRYTQQISPVGSVASEPTGTATSRLKNHSKGSSSGYSVMSRSRLHSSSPGCRGSTSSLIWDSFTGPSSSVAPPSNAQISSTVSSQTPSMGMTQTSLDGKSDSLSLKAEWHARKSFQVQGNNNTSNVSAKSSDSLARRVQKLLATTAYLDLNKPQEVPGRARLDSDHEGFTLSRSLSPHSAHRQKLMSEHGRSASTDDLTRAQHHGYSQMQHQDMRGGSMEGLQIEGHSTFRPDISQDVGTYPSFEHGGPDGMSSVLIGSRAPSRVSSISISPRMSPHPVIPISRQGSVDNQENIESLVHQVRMILGADAPQERVDRIIRAALLEEGRQSAELDQFYSSQNLSEYPLTQSHHYGSDPHLAQHRPVDYQQYSPGGSSGNHANLRNIAAISQARNLISNQIQRVAQNQFDHSVDIRGMPTDYDRHTPVQHRSSPQVPPMRMMDDWQRREAWLEQAEKAAHSDRLAYGILPERTSPLSASRSPSRTSSSMASSPDRFFGISPQQSPKKPYGRDSDPYFEYGSMPNPHSRSRPYGRQFQTIAAMETNKQYGHREPDWNDPYHYHNSSRPGSVHEVPSRHAQSFDLPNRPLSADNHGQSAFHSVPKAHMFSRRGNPRYHTVSGIDPTELMRHASHMGAYPARMPDRSASYGAPVYEHLHPYKPPGRSDVMYTYPYGNEGSSPAHTETTMESTHPGSDDAQPPHFPRHVLGDRQETHEKYSPSGIYSNNPVVLPNSKSHRSPPAAKSHVRPVAWDVPKDLDTGKEQFSPPGQRIKKVGGVTTWKEMSLSKSSSEGEDKSEEEGERSSRKHQERHQYRDDSVGRKREESPHKSNNFFVGYKDPEVMDSDREDTMEAEMDRIRNNLERSRSGIHGDARPIYQSPPFHRKGGGSSNGTALPGGYSRQALQQVQQENASDNQEYAQARDEYQRSKVKEKKELDRHQLERLTALIQNPGQYYTTRSSTGSIGEISDDASSISSTGSLPRRRKKWRKDAKFTPKQQSPEEADRNFAEDIQHQILEEEEKDESNTSSSDETKPDKINRLHTSKENTKTTTSPSDIKYDDILKETTLSDLSVDSERLYRMLGAKGVEKLSTKLLKLQQKIEMQKEQHKRRITVKKVPLAVIGPTSSSESEVSNIMSTDSSLYSSELHRVSEGHERLGRKPLRTHIDRFHKMPERSSSVESEPMYRSRTYRHEVAADSTDGLASDITSDTIGKPQTKPRRSQSLHDKASRGKGYRKRDESPGDNGLSESDDQVFHKPSRPAPRSRDKTSAVNASKRPIKGTAFTVDVGEGNIQDAARRRKDKLRDKENQRDPRSKEPGAKPKTRSLKTGDKPKKSSTPESPDDEKKKEIIVAPPKPVEKPVGWFQPFSSEMPWVQEKKDPMKHENPPDPLAKVSLKEAFEIHKLSFISKSKERVKKVKLAAEERQIQEHYEKERLKMFQEEKPKHANPHAHPLSDQLHSPKRRVMSRKEMKAQTERIYSNLPEVKKKIEGQKRTQANQTNRLRAQLYKKKLMERLKGKQWTGPSI
ncbi:uncharacterized protein [Antedon mediterranea]|uniref:uncharacterized protein n=1 Tax=Antedon mediterranea TaxID=105859 RepID=UPI003AF7DED7